MRDALTRRDVAKALIALPLATLPVMAFAAPGDDPIYAAISAHWETEEAFGRLLDRGRLAGEGEDDWDAEHSAACDVAFDAQWAILEVEPTTAAGVLALLDYIVTFRCNGYREFVGRGLEDHELTGHAIGDERGVSFEDDAMRFASRHLRRLLALPAEGDADA